MGRFGSRDIKLEIGIFLPVAEEQRKLEKESVVGVAKRRKRLRTGVAVQTTVKGFARLDEVFPVFETVRVGFLRENVSRERLDNAAAFVSAKKLTTKALYLRTEAYSSSAPP